VDLIQATITVEQVGSYAGFAAVLGLAVLSALYFSQARDVRRLRDWAGRAPERDADARSRVAAATPAGQAQQQRTPAPGAAQPAAAGNSGTAPATAGAAGAPAVSKAPAVAASGAGAGAGGAAGATRGGVSSPARPLGARPSAQTSILGAQEQPRERWYRRIAPRYIALIVAGVLVVGGGIAVGAIQLLSGSDSGGGGGGGGGSAAQPAAQKEKSGGASVKAADVKVAVLNATGIAGLADQFADKAQAQGFVRDNVGNAPGGQRAESVVLYAPGKQAQAKLVRRKFKISNIEPVDAESQKLAPEADAFLVIGSDNTQ
jgi:hypothetical protein